MMLLPLGRVFVQASAMHLVLTWDKKGWPFGFPQSFGSICILPFCFASSSANKGFFQNWNGCWISIVSCFFLKLASGTKKHSRGQVQINGEKDGKGVSLILSHHHQCLPWCWHLWRCAYLLGQKELPSKGYVLLKLKGFIAWLYLSVGNWPSRFWLDVFSPFRSHEATLYSCVRLRVLELIYLSKKVFYCFCSQKVGSFWPINEQRTEMGDCQNRRMRDRATLAFMRVWLSCWFFRSLNGGINPFLCPDLRGIKVFQPILHKIKHNHCRTASSILGLAIIG